MSAFCRRKVDLPPIFGPVSNQMEPPVSASPPIRQSFATKGFAACARKACSTTGWRPAVMASPAAGYAAAYELDGRRDSARRHRLEHSPRLEMTPLGVCARFEPGVDRGLGVPPPAHFPIAGGSYGLMIACRLDSTTAAPATLLGLFRLGAPTGLRLAFRRSGASDLLQITTRATGVTHTLASAADLTGWRTIVIADDADSGERCWLDGELVSTRGAQSFPPLGTAPGFERLGSGADHGGSTANVFRGAIACCRLLTRHAAERVTIDDAQTFHADPFAPLRRRGIRRPGEAEEAAAIAAAPVADEPAGPGTQNPLLDAGGLPAPIFAWPAEAVDEHAVVVNAGPYRQTARTNESPRRVWVVRAGPADADAAGRITDLLERCAHGCVPTRWRSPDEFAAGDTAPAGPTPVADAPLWLARRADTQTIDRAPGGAFGSISLTLERLTPEASP